MRYEWDPGKAQRNLEKHDIDLADATAVLEDALALTLEDDAHDEPRFVTMGLDTLGRLLVVVHAHPAPGVIRLISARRATPRERRAYEGGT